MSKKYNGKDMAKSSRFIEYLKTMSEVDLRKVEDKIDILIKENKEYWDKGNYQHLSNIFTCMALYNILKDDGMSENDNEKLIGCSLFDLKWASELDNTIPTSMIVSGVFSFVTAEKQV